MITYENLLEQLRLIYGWLQADLQIPNEDMETYFDAISPLAQGESVIVALPEHIVRYKYGLLYVLDCIDQLEDDERANLLEHLVTCGETLLCAATSLLLGHDYFHNDDGETAFTIKLKNGSEYVLIAASPGGKHEDIIIQSS